MFSVIKTNEYPKIGLPGEHLGGYVIDESDPNKHDIKTFFELLSLDGVSGAFTQLMDEKRADDISLEVKNYIENVVIKNGWDEMNEDCFFVEKILLNGKYYLNFLYQTDFESYGVYEILKKNEIDFVVYGADENDYDPVYTLVEARHNGNTTSKESDAIYLEMKTWLEKNIKLEETSPSCWNDTNFPDYSLSYARYVCEHGADY